jgi:hypothetical protein
MITWLSLSISRKLVASFVTIFFLTYLQRPQFNGAFRGAVAGASC